MWRVFFQILVWVSLFSAACVALDDAAGPIEIDARVDRAEITIGDRINYQLEIVHQADVEVTRPEWGAGLQGFQILDFDQHPPQTLDDGRVLLKDQYEISTFTPEDYVIPPLSVYAKLTDGATAVLQTQPIQIKVNSVLPTDQEAFELRPAKPPVPVYSGLNRTLLAGLLFGTGALIILVGALIWYRKLKSEQPPEVPAIPEDQQALAELAKLRDSLEGWSNPPVEQQYRPFAFEFSEVLRQYLERRYDFKALEMTSDEIVRLFQHKHPGLPDLEPPQQGWLLDILQQTDLTKFARIPITADTAVAWLSDTESFVQQTRRVELAEVDQDESTQLTEEAA